MRVMVLIGQLADRVKTDGHAETYLTLLPGSCPVLIAYMRACHTSRSGALAASPAGSLSLIHTCATGQRGWRVMPQKSPEMCSGQVRALAAPAVRGPAIVRTVAQRGETGFRSGEEARSGGSNRSSFHLT